MIHMGGYTMIHLGGYCYSGVGLSCVDKGMLSASEVPMHKMNVFVNELPSELNNSQSPMYSWYSPIWIMISSTESWYPPYLLIQDNSGSAGTDDPTSQYKGKSPQWKLSQTKQTSIQCQTVFTYRSQCEFSDCSSFGLFTWYKDNIHQFMHMLGHKVVVR